MIRDYLDNPSVRATIGVDSHLTKNFTSCSADVGRAFGATQDVLHPTADYVASLLERGVRVLIYVVSDFTYYYQLSSAVIRLQFSVHLSQGTYDWICNHVGNERWTVALDWSGKNEFSNTDLRDWMVGGKSAGKTRSAKGFTFATITGAGHMVSSYIALYILINSSRHV